MVTQSSETKHEREIVITRLLDAPRELVFKAWTEPEQVSQWFGPTGFTIPTCEIDLRVGGVFYLVMRGPDGSEFPMRGVYAEVRPPERLAFKDEALGPDGTTVLEGFTDVTFAAEGNKTRMTVRSGGVGYGDMAAMMLDGMEEGWTQTLDHLEQTLVADRAIITRRVFDAPRELVYKVWTQPEHVAQWWGPNGFTNTIQEMDVRVGGVWRLIMHGPDGRDYPNKIVFTEVTPPARLVYDHSGDDGEVEFHTTVTFSPDGQAGEKTRLTLQAVFASVAERNKVAEEYGAIEGAEQTLARLADYLATM
jgi:uncharacterized protein YndB with AHSA1/START domain